MRIIYRPGTYFLPYCSKVIYLISRIYINQNNLNPRKVIPSSRTITNLLNYSYQHTPLQIDLISLTYYPLKHVPL